MDPLIEKTIRIRKEYELKWKNTIKEKDEENRKNIERELNKQRNNAIINIQNPFRIAASKNENRQVKTERGVIVPDYLDNELVDDEEIDMCVYHIHHNGKMKKVTIQPHVLERREALPISNTWTGIRQNFRVDDDPELGHKPYLGEKVEETVMSSFYTKMKSLSDMSYEYETALLKYAIERLGGSLDITYCSVQEILIKHLRIKPERIDQILQEPVAPVSSKKKTCEDELNQEAKQYLDMMDSYRLLFCRQCYMYDCNMHGYKMQIPSLAIQQQKAFYYRDLAFNEKAPVDRPCSARCFRLQSDVEPDFIIENELDAIIRKAFQVFSGNFCEMQYSVGAELSCQQLATYCEQNGMSTEALHTEISRHVAGLQKKQPKKRRLYSNVFVKRAHQVQQVVTASEPCAHEGPCKAGTCACVDKNIFCTKHCYCIGEICTNFFPGCRCSKKCRTKQCHCFAAARECDIDICIGCDAHISPAEGACLNQDIRLLKHKRLFISASIIPGAGWGLFTHANGIKKNEFIHEYVGEIISQEEAERRGHLYDQLNRSFLFNLNNEYVIDAGRKGNKTKFINHSKKPNCYTRIVSVNSEHKVGIYALHDIEPFTELYFDYRYDKTLVHDELWKGGMQVDWMRDSSMAGQVNANHVYDHEYHDEE